MKITATASRHLPAADLLTPHEVTRALSVHRRTLNAMVARGDFPPPVRITLKTIRWRRTDVEKALGLTAEVAEGAA